MTAFLALLTSGLVGVVSTVNVPADGSTGFPGKERTGAFRPAVLVLTRELAVCPESGGEHRVETKAAGPTAPRALSEQPAAAPLLTCDSIPMGRRYVF